MTAVRYVSLNPVRARLVAQAQDWPWSSVSAHLAGRDDGLVTVRSVLERVSDFGAWPRAGNDNDYTALRASEGTGRPLCAPAMVADLERVLGRPIARRAAGQRPNASDNAPTTTVLKGNRLPCRRILAAPPVKDQTRRATPNHDCFEGQ